VELLAGAGAGATDTAAETIKRGLFVVNGEGPRFVGMLPVVVAGEWTGNHVTGLGIASALPAARGILVNGGQNGNTDNFGTILCANRCLLASVWFSGLHIAPARDRVVGGFIYAQDVSRCFLSFLLPFATGLTGGLAEERGRRSRNPGS